jgi:predicted protein tyrosine phosphatase
MGDPMRSAFLSIRSMPLRLAGRWQGPRSLDVAMVSIVTPGDVEPALDYAHRCIVGIEDGPGGPEDVLVAACDRIAHFALVHAHSGKMLAVHCTLGVARSPAVASALATFFTMTPWHMSPAVYPNQRVGNAMLEALFRMNQRWVVSGAHDLVEL